MKRRTQSNGVYFDRSTKGGVGKQHHSYRAEVVEDGRRIRRRFCTYEAGQEWIAKMCECGGAPDRGNPGGERPAARRRAQGVSRTGECR